MPDINMPKLSDTMEEGTVLEWKKQAGDQVTKGEVIADIETDKASFEIEAEADGVLEIVAEAGKPVAVGALIGRLGKPGEASKKPQAGPAAKEGAEEPDASQAAGESQETAEPAPSAEAAEKQDKEGPAAGEPQAEPAPAAETTSADAQAPDRGRAASRPREEAEAPSPGRTDGRIKASPLARRLAEERGVDLAQVKGTGPEGRIVKEDVLGMAREPSAVRRQRPEPRPTGPEVEVEEPTRMQAAVARRMTQSKTSVPHFYVTVEAHVDEAVKMRRQLKETVAEASGVTVTDMIIRACAIALGKFPTANASWVDGHFEMKRRINVGIAVALPKGLVVPVLKDADKKDLVQISIESRQLVERARAGKLSESDLAGGTFSISNLGMFGVDEFSAIINPPEAAILAVGAIKDAPVVVDGRLAVGKVMRMTISVDHRVFYGADAAQLLAEVKRLLENPVSLVLPPEEP